MNRISHINLNDKIRVKLGARAYELHEQWWNSFRDSEPTWPPYERPIEDENGYTEWQIHEFMYIFGTLMNGRADAILDYNVVIVSEN